MKYFSIITLVILMYSCGSSKKVIEKTNKKDPITETIVENKTEAVLETTEVELEKIPEKTTETETNTDTEPIIDDTVKNTIETKPNATIDSKTEKPAFVLSHSAWDDLLKRHVSEKGNVNYQGFKSSKAQLNLYIKSLQETPPQPQWSKNETLAYWINAYNALTIDLILRNYPTKSIKDIKDPWDQRLWKFGDKWQNLNDIEHVILRNMDAPTMHFAIVCASVSCPKLQNKAFRADVLDTQLTAATKEFLNDTTKNELSENSIKLSKIFKWFAKDFKTDGSIIAFLNRYADVQISENAKKSFKDYDWGLND